MVSAAARNGGSQSGMTLLLSRKSARVAGPAATVGSRAGWPPAYDTRPLGTRSPQPRQADEIAADYRELLAWGYVENWSCTTRPSTGRPLMVGA
jgi:hypothetical protein